MSPKNDVIFEWIKLGRIFDPSNPDAPDWVQQYAQAPNTVNVDGTTYMFFCSRLNPDSSGQFVSRVGSLELEIRHGLNISNISAGPIIPLGDLGTFDEFGTYPFSPVIVGNTVYAAYAGWTRCDSTPFDVNIGLATADVKEMSFTKYGSGPILSKSLTEPFVISSPKLRFYNGTFYLFYIAGKKWITDGEKLEPVYTIRMATSEDCINWKKNESEIIPRILGDEEAQASPDVFFYSGYFHMFFCYRYATNFRDTDRGYKMGYAYSHDLVNWIRDDSRSNLVTSKEGWDSESVSYPHVFSLENDVYMAYLGNNIGKTGIGLAKLSSNED